jgi:hypothetical protein
VAELFDMIMVCHNLDPKIPSDVAFSESRVRAMQTADCMKKARGRLPEDAPGGDNFRVLRFIAKVTINPAITQGIGHALGSIAPGKLGGGASRLPNDAGLICKVVGMETAPGRARVRQFWSVVRPEVAGAPKGGVSAGPRAARQRAPKTLITLPS